MRCFAVMRGPRASFARSEIGATHNMIATRTTPCRLPPGDCAGGPRASAAAFRAERHRTRIELFSALRLDEGALADGVVARTRDEDKACGPAFASLRLDGGSSPGGSGTCSTLYVPSGCGAVFAITP